jgi:tetratricopeptide (TPR) repeat protein
MSVQRTTGAGQLERAALLVDAGRYADARRILAAVLAEDPTDASALCVMALCAHGEGNHAEALTVANRAVAAGPDEEWAHRIASMALTKTGQHGEAVRAAREAVRLAPYDWHTHVQLSVTLAALAPLTHNLLAPLPTPRRRTLREARAEAARAIEQAPDHPGPHFAMGYAEQAAGQARRARASYRRTLALDPHDVPARNNLAVLDLRRHSVGAAAQGFASALRSDPHFALGPRNLETAGMRLLRHLYWAGLLAFVLAVTATYSPVPVRVLLVSVVIIGAGAYVLHTCRAMPAPARRFLLKRLTTPGTRLFWSGLVTTAMTALALYVGFGPAPGAQVLGGSLLVPVIVLNLMAVAAISRRNGR